MCALGDITNYAEQGHLDEWLIRPVTITVASLPEAPRGKVDCRTLRFRPVFDQATDLYRSARRAANTIRSGVDCLIAACAIKHSLAVLHRDRDFDLLAKVSSLESRRI